MCLSPILAILAENLYEDLELWYPALRFQEAGAEVTIVGSGAAAYTSKHGYPVQADAKAAEVCAADFDAVIIPGCHRRALGANPRVCSALAFASALGPQPPAEAESPVST